jgi:hypothetical protein
MAALILPAVPSEIFTLNMNGTQSGVWLETIC